MTALPPIADLTGASRTEGQAKSWFTDLRAFLADLLGTAGTQKGARDALGLNLEQGLVELLKIDYDTGHRDLAAARYDPAFFNQQWGGAPHYFEMVDAATGTPYRFEAATGNIEDNNTAQLADASARTWRSMGFKVSKDQSISAIWVKLYKVGNPTNNLELRILPDDGTGTKPTGSTAITNGTATAQSGKLHSADSAGQWYRFSFSTACALTAGTQYHIALKSSGAVDGSNYWIPKAYATKKYPHGNDASGDATPTWSAGATVAWCFMVESASSVASLQTGGLFSDGKLTFFEGSPLNQSNGRVKDLKDFEGLDLTDFSLIVRGTAWTKDKTIFEFQYGLDHDRIVLRANATTGYAQIDVYESDGTKHTVTGSTDVSTGDHDIMIRVRAKGDGSDVVSLYVDGSSQGTPVSSATITFDTLFGLAQIGTFWLGGGFALAPTWTLDQTMSALPSSGAVWTWTGGGTEANCMSVSGGKLYQNKNGYGASDTGYYGKTFTANNANGLAVVSKVAVKSDPNGNQSAPIFIDTYDGTKRYAIALHEYFIQPYIGSWPSVVAPQGENKHAEHVYTILGKSSDALVFRDGRLIIDATANNTGATASNGVNFGDFDAASGANADAVWDYVKYYTTAWLPPQFTAGSLSELAIWTGDKTSLASPLYNSGSFVSVKQYCGIQKNYLKEVPMRLTSYGITPSQNTSSTSGVVETDMEQFVIGSSISAEGHTTYQHNNVGGGNGYMGITVDGAGFAGTGVGTGASFQTRGDQTWGILTAKRGAGERFYFGLHKLEKRIATNTASITLTAGGPSRYLDTEVHA